MTEEEKPECKLTFREGNEIYKEAQKPYERTVIMIFVFGLIIGVIGLTLCEFSGFFGIQTTGELDALLADGEISQAVYDYMVNRQNSIMRGGIGFIVMCMFSTAIGFEVLGEQMAKRELKKANEGKE